MDRILQLYKNQITEFIIIYQLSIFHLRYELIRRKQGMFLWKEYIRINLFRSFLDLNIMATNFFPQTIYNIKDKHADVIAAMKVIFQTNNFILS